MDNKKMLIIFSHLPNPRMIKENLILVKVMQYQMVLKLE